YLMDDKKAMLNNQFENIHFITCDLNQHQELESLLKENGWQPQHPSLIILEGIIYYLDKNALMGLLQFFADKNVALCGDFALTPETVSEQNRKFGTGVFQKISRSVGDITVQFYDPNAFIKMLVTWGYPNPVRVLMSAIQIERTGAVTPYEGTESGWISLFHANFS